MQHNKVYLSVNAVRVTSSDKSIKLNHDIFKRYFEHSVTQEQSDLES
jgi:hypothetical protein